MAKKNITAAEFNEFIENVSDLSQTASFFAKQSSNCKLDDFPIKHTDIQSLVAASRDLNQLALSLFVQADIQRMRAETATMQSMLDQKAIEP